MTKAIRMYETGGPDVLSWEEDDPGKPGTGEALVRHKAVGLNFIDVYHRTGLYPLPSLPAVPGLEGAGIVEEIGEGVSEIAVGDLSLIHISEPTRQESRSRMPSYA